MDTNSFFSVDNPYPEQIRLFEEAVAAFDSGKKFVILEAPTGNGKSHIARALHNYYEENSGGKSFIVTQSRALQSQYYRDFDCALYQGRSNYSCGRNARDTCDVGYYANKTKLGRYGYCQGVCPYTKAREAARAHPFTIFNYASFLYSNKGELFEPRHLLILDEGHNLESQLMSFVNIEIPLKKLKNYPFKTNILNINDMAPSKQKETVAAWFAELDAFMKVQEKQEDKEIMVLNVSGGPAVVKSRKIKEAGKNLKFMETLREKIALYLARDEDEEWVYFIEETRLGDKIFMAKPLYVSAYTNPIFASASRILIMSATIRPINIFTKNLGIAKGDYEFLESSSAFDAHNRQIHCDFDFPQFNHSNLQDNLPYIAQEVKKLLAKHPNEKGIIHTTNFRIMEYLKKTLPNPDKRLIFSSTGQAQNALLIHATREDATVMVAPNMTEGVDLKDELSRFQIVIKIPYPPLGDAQIKRRMQIDRDWYTWCTALSLIQTCGRSVRNQEDWAVTYILDGGAKRMFKRDKKFFPQWFLDSIQNLKPKKTDFL